MNYFTEYRKTGKMIKKISTLFILIGVLGFGFQFLPESSKLSIFTSIEKPWARIRPSKPGSFIQEDILQAKLKKGLPEWAKKQIEEDLSHFPKISKAELDSIYQAENSAHNSLARITIKNKTVHIETKDSETHKRRSYKIMKNVLEFLAKKGYVQDTDFVMSLQDYLILENPKKLPILVFAKDVSVPYEQDLILIPDWMNLRNWADLRPRIKYASHLYPWEKKQPILFWRGGFADKSGFRRKLIAMADKYPTLINAKFSQDNPKEYVSEEKHVQYKYQLTVDGVRGTWERLVWQLQSNSLVLKHQSNHVQWFYKGIEPYVDYIPVTDEGSLLNQIAWAESHPEEAKKIIQHAVHFADDNLTLEDMVHYLIVVLQTYTEKMT